MKTINFDYTGGFPLEQPVLKRMQSATLLALEALVKQLGCADTGNYILSGCNVSGANITPGIMYIDGELCPFAGAVGDATTKIKKQTNTLTAPFENGTNPPVFIETVAVVNAAGTELQNFTKFFYVQDANYVHTDNNFTAALLTKLNGIETGAEVNVRTNWNEINPLSDAYLIGRPTIQNILYSGEQLIGNFPSDGLDTQRMTIAFPSVGTSNYKVKLYVKSISPIGSSGQDAIPIVTSNYQNSSFDIVGRQFSGDVQNLVIYYDLIQL